MVEAFHPERIYAFGSHVRGEATPDSDVDLLIVVPVTNEPHYKLAQKAHALAAPHCLPLDILVMSHSEFDWRSRAKASLPATVLREGCSLYAA